MTAAPISAEPLSSVPPEPGGRTGDITVRPVMSNESTWRPMVQAGPERYPMFVKLVTMGASMTWSTIPPLHSKRAARRAPGADPGFGAIADSVEDASHHGIEHPQWAVECEAGLVGHHGR